ncbi:RNA polymerase factor sigma-54 [Rhodobacter sp. NSM]|uniref:RNA polymerase factor sigma-54 n=1 Tax=Rhodobacter sp. NSM TaxID=3457501 RepID=UPI003FD13843
MSRAAMRLGQRQVQKTSFLPALALLRMDSADLAAHLAAEAERNPFLRLRRPAGGAAAPVPVEPAAAAPGLHEHVLRQIGLRLPDEELPVAWAFLEALEPTGWLGASVAAVAEAAGVSEGEARATLARLQQLEPAGLFARNLRECLALQAAERDQLTPAMQTVLDCLDLLAEAGPRAVAARTGLAEPEVEACLAAIRRMDPKPGARFIDAAASPLREPDLIVQRGESGWTVELNRSSLPELRVEAAPPGPLSAELAALRLRGRDLQRALLRRATTVLSVGTEAVRRQQAFLDRGPEALAPLRLADVARPLGLHPSTVSRVVNGLLIATPRGLFAVRTLFPAPMAETGELTAAALQARIRALVAAEDARRPLDDGALAAALDEAGLRVARRTVAKHRALAGIPPVLRRQSVDAG